MNHIPYELDRTEDPKIGEMAPGIEDMTERLFTSCRKRATRVSFFWWKAAASITLITRIMPYWRWRKR